MQMRIREITDRLKRSTLFRDSLWAVCGNGFGNALLLFAGIWIARLLGKDLYGEYGVVKTNMFYMAGLSTFGLVYSSTRYIARYLASDKTRIPGVIRNATRITFAFSTLIAIALSLAAPRIETFLETPGIAPVFRMLSVIIVFKALASTGNGILAGLGKFSLIAKSNVVSGALMFALCVPLTYFAGLYGALFSLAVSQLVNAAVNYWYICGESRRLPIYCYCEDSVGSLLRFSFPIALQEISYALCNWCGILMLTKLSSLSEVGLYSASVQWNAVICLIPGLLANVVLSHLSKTDGAQQQQRLVSRLLAVYLICTAVPFVLVYLFADVIISFYGADFIDMKRVLHISILATIPTCCSDVFKAELIAVGRPWIRFSLRMAKDLILVSLACYFLLAHGGASGAYYYTVSNLLSVTLFFIGTAAAYRFVGKTTNG